MTNRPLSAAALDAGVAQGVLSLDQVTRLRALDAELASGASAEPALPDRAAAGPRDPENLRFVGGFADVFVTIGIALFLGALGSLAAGAGAFLNVLAVSIASWGLAEYFVRQRRMALPSIALLVAFVLSTALLGRQIYMAVVLHMHGLPLHPRLIRAPFDASDAWSLGTMGLSGALAAWLHYARFRVPITVAAGTLSLVGLALAGIAAAAPEAFVDHLRWFLLAAGAAVFALAMRFDLKDRLRTTRDTDIAFWLHLLAAPLLVRGVLPLGDGGLFLPSTLPDQPLLILGVFAVLAAVSIVIDRRALLVSGLLFAGSAAFAVLRGVGLDQGSQLGLTVLALGAFILALSAGWQPLRRLLLRPLPEGVTARIPPVRVV